jgi:hypothetical protein
VFTFGSAFGVGVQGSMFANPELWPSNLNPEPGTVNPEL